MPSIFIHVLAYGGTVCTELAAAIALASSQLERRNIEFKTFWSNIPGIAKTRNIGAALMLADPNCTHLLQIDRDMTFQPSAILRMLDEDRDVIGCIAKLKSESAGYNFTDPLEPTNQPVFRVRGVGTGISLCKRSVLERLIASGRLRSEPAAGGLPEIHGFFDSIYLANGAEIQDDFAFCLRWSEFCGGEIHALAGEQIGHIGRTVFTAHFGHS